jgi:hypothetical protein
MKRFISLLILTLVASLASADDVIKRGAAIGDAKAVPLADVLAKADAYAKTPVVVEGVIKQNCENKGCWMVLAPAMDKDGVRVTFKDYAFFIPLDSKGMKARAEGVTAIKTLSKKEADHLEGEGAKLKRNADGTANEISFVASGVELRH